MIRRAAFFSALLAVGTLGFADGFLAGAPDGEDPVQLAMSEAVTGNVMSQLEGGTATCGALDAVYQFDCYRQAYRAAGSKIKGRPDYRDAAKALKTVESTLNTIVRKNADRSQPSIRVGGRTYKAIKPEAIPAATSSFRSARTQAATVLLRSDDVAALHYTRIADALNSDKVLIRT